MASTVRMITRTLSTNLPILILTITQEDIVAELIFTTLATMIWSSYSIFLIARRAEHGLASTFLVDAIVFGILWLFWLVGAAVASVRYRVLFLP